MKRVEIIASRAIEENIIDALKKADAAKFYTKYPVVHGVGSNGPRMGDAIWPEENFVMIIWCEDEEALRIVNALTPVKTQYPNEGIKIFGA